jgi:hypothetical protein
VQLRGGDDDAEVIVGSRSMVCFGLAEDHRLPVDQAVDALTPLDLIEGVNELVGLAPPAQDLAQELIKMPALVVGERSSCDADFHVVDEYCDLPGAQRIVGRAWEKVQRWPSRSSATYTDEPG